jgi:hypothetical protein
MEDSAPNAGARQRAEAILDKRDQQELDIVEQQRQAQRNEIEKLPTPPQSSPSQGRSRSGNTGGCRRQAKREAEALSACQSSQRDLRVCTC